MSKRFRPFGTAYYLPIRGKAKVTMTARNGASIETYVYIVDDPNEQSLLGRSDALRMGIVTLNPDGAKEEINIPESCETTNRISKLKKAPIPTTGIVSGGQTQLEIDTCMKSMSDSFPKLFANKTGKFKGPPIKVQLHPNATPVIQPPRKIPLHYLKPLETELMNMLGDDVIEGPIEIEEPGTYISNLVITDKKWDPSGKQIRLTLDCQAVNRDIYHTHEPIPTSEELRHQFAGSDRFSVLDLTNCFHQFEIEEEARKLFS